MWTLRAALVLGLLSGCGQTKGNDSELATDPPDVPDAEMQEPEVPKPGTVSIEVPVVVHRSVEQGPDGDFEWGETEPIDDAETCVIERRDAYAIFEPYEPLDDPICVTTPAGGTPRLSGIPANSDLTITVSKDGYFPVAYTLRVEASDTLLDPDLSAYRTVLFDRDQADLFMPTPEADGEEQRDDDERGRLAIEVSMLPVVPGDPGSIPSVPGDQEQAFADVPTNFFRLAKDADLSLKLEQDGPTLQFDFEGNQLMLDVVAGTYRVLATHPRAPCEPLGTPFAYTLWGLGTDTFSELEVRVLPGHVSVLLPLCLCIPATTSHVYVDAPTCTFEEG